MSKNTAPLVTYPTGRSRVHGFALLLVWAAGFALTVFWLSGIPAAGWHTGLAVTALAAGGAGSLWGWLHSPQGLLVWDGDAWHWESTGYQTGSASHSLSVVADFQRLMVLRLENHAHATLWLFIERSAMPERWLDLRRAVYSPAPSSLHRSNRKKAFNASPVTVSGCDGSGASPVKT